MLVIAITTAIQALSSMAILILPSIAPIAAAAIGVDAAIIGYYVSFVYAAAIGGVLVGGGLVSRVGACRTCQLSLVIVGVGCFILSTAIFEFVVLGAFFVGFGYGLPNPAAAHLLAKYTEPKRRNFAFSVKQAGVPLGGTLAGLFAPLLAGTIAWWASLILCAILSFGLAVALRIGRPSWDSEVKQQEVLFWRDCIMGVRLILSSTRLRVFAFIGFVLSGLQLCFIGFFVVILSGELGFKLIVAGIVLATAQAGGIISRVSFGWIGDYLNNGQRVLFGCSTVLAVLFFFSAGFDAGTPGVVIIISFLLLGWVVLGWNGVFFAEISRLSSTQVASVTAGALLFTYVGVLTWPSIFAILLEGTQGVQVGLILLSVGAFLVCAALIWSQSVGPIDLNDGGVQE